MIDTRISVVVPTGESSEYEFRVTTGNNVEVWNGSRRDSEFGLGHHYHTFEGKATTAVMRLAERCHALEAFFQAARKVSITDLHGGRLNGFIERDDAGEEEGMDEAYETLATMIEEADAEEEKTRERMLQK